MDNCAPSFEGIIYTKLYCFEGRSSFILGKGLNTLDEKL
jgi:hypothetical protein